MAVKQRGVLRDLVAYLLFDLVADIRVILEIIQHLFTTLAYLHIIVAEPASALLNDVEINCGVDNLAHLGNALTVQYIELRGLEGRRNLVLYDLALGAVADYLAAVLDRLAAAHLDTHGGVELQRASAGSGLGVAVHYADLLAYLVDEYCNGVGVADYSGELSHRLGHQSRLHAYVSVAHVAVYLRLGGHSRNRVEDDDVDSAGAHQSFNYLQSLLAGVRLGNQ